LDQTALWSSLGVSLLLIVAGSLLVLLNGLTLSQALLAILVGAVIGNVLLGLAAIVGAETGVPAMVALRAPLGLRGSYLPTALNVLQNIGWGTFEIVIMALAADQISTSLLGFSSPILWVTVFAVICTLFAIGGPLVVVRQWIERFAIWAVLASTLYLTWYLITRYDIGALLSAPSTGGNFWLGVDLVVALPISWFPLVSDYSRFSREARSAFWGTAIGLFHRERLVLRDWRCLCAGAGQRCPCRLSTVFAVGLSSSYSSWERRTRGSPTFIQPQSRYRTTFLKARQILLSILIGGVCAA
jgi:putative hydroxymethylpyrimidine transporter CytX